MNISFSSFKPIAFQIKLIPCRKMQPKSQPIFQKLSNFLKVSIFVAKMRRPIIPKLLFLKKSWRSKNFELLQYYNYGVFRQFEFSPSTTPLFRFYRGRRTLRLRHRDLCSVLFPCTCVGGFGAEEGGGGGYRVEEAVPEALDWSELWSDEDGSIDRRAELFIEKFYADRKIERLASI